MKSTTKENAMRKKGKAARPCAVKVWPELNVDTGGKKSKIRFICALTSL